jgi:hypothetical protein
VSAAAGELEGRVRTGAPAEIAAHCDALAARLAELQAWLAQDAPAGGSG